jgi:hypothetical protein
MDVPHGIPSFTYSLNILYKQGLQHTASSKNDSVGEEDKWPKAWTHSMIHTSKVRWLHNWTHTCWSHYKELLKYSVKLHFKIMCANISSVGVFKFAPTFKWGVVTLKTHQQSNMRDRNIRSAKGTNDGCQKLYSDTSANDDNSFRNYIR